MSLFAAAKTIATPSAKGRAPKVETIEMPGLQKYAAIDAAVKSLTALLKVEEVAIKSSMMSRFIALATKDKTRPANYKGVDDTATGSCQLKARSSASVLSEAEQIMLRDHGVPFEEAIKTEEAFVINPAYTNNLDLLNRVEEALMGVDLPADFLLKQPKSSVHIVNEESIEAVCKKTPEEMEFLMPLVTTLAVKPTIEGDFWGVLDEVMQPPVEKTA